MFNLNFDLDLQLTLVKHKHAHRLIIADIRAVICKTHQGFKKYRADSKCSHTMFNLNFDLDLQLTLVKHKHCTSAYYS